VVTVTAPKLKRNRHYISYQIRRWGFSGKSSSRHFAPSPFSDDEFDCAAPFGEIRKLCLTWRLGLPWRGKTTWKYFRSSPKGSNCSNQKKPIYYIFVRCFLVWLLKIVFFKFLNEIKLHAKIQFEPKYAIINKEDSSIRLYIFK
jgi:hypothetical protein